MMTPEDEKLLRVGLEENNPIFKNLFEREITHDLNSGEVYILPEDTYSYEKITMSIKIINTSTSENLYPEINLPGDFTEMPLCSYDITLIFEKFSNIQSLVIPDGIDGGTDSINAEECGLPNFSRVRLVFGSVYPNFWFSREAI